MRLMERVLTLGVLMALSATSVLAQQAAGRLDRSVLPVPEPQYPAVTEEDARKAKAPPRFEVKAPASAPNVVIVLIDDIGFGHASTFGGPIQMPTLQSLADGLRYNRLHTPPSARPRGRPS
jgi:Sulfatase